MKLAPFDDNLTINFACKSREECRTCAIENWMVVSRGYFLHASSHSENVASARRVTLFPIELEFGRVSFWGYDKTRVPREKLSKQGKELTTNSTLRLVYIHDNSPRLPRGLRSWIQHWSPALSSGSPYFPNEIIFCG